jgi:uncharacterized protein with von Willebrand factor type A (vWA) domain
VPAEQVPAEQVPAEQVPAEQVPAEHTAPLGNSPQRLVVAFSRMLRRAGLAVPVGDAIVFAQALGKVGLDRRAPVYWAGRATLVHRPEDIASYDQVFSSFWLGLGQSLDTASPTPVTLALDDGDDTPGVDEPDAAGGQTLSVRYSAAEVLRHQDFAAYSDAEWAEARRLLSLMRLHAEPRRSRRRRPSARQRGQPDVARTIRRALESDGEPIRRAWRAPSTRPRRLVLLVDVSGSMEPYARALLRFAHAAVSSRGTSAVEVFTLGTRITRITRQLWWRDPDAALAEAGHLVEDWSGGTRLGAGLRMFNDRWGAKGMARGAVVVILSDGWDRGDPAELGEQMARLARVARRVVWVNPLKASPGYAPLARGLAAALTYVDQFIEGHSLEALEQLALVIAGAGVGERGSRL